MYKISKIRPLFTGVVTTAYKYTDDARTQGGLIVGNKLAGTLNPIQQVIAKGKMVSDVEEGEWVKLNFNRYLKAKHLPGAIEDNVQSDNMQAHYEIPMITLEGYGDCLFVQNNDIEFVIEEGTPNDGGLYE